FVNRRDEVGRRLRRNCVCRSNRRYQSIPPLGDGLNEAGFFRVVLENSPQFGDGACKHALADERVGPDGLQKLFFGNRFVGVLGPPTPTSPSPPVGRGSRSARLYSGWGGPAKSPLGRRFPRVPRRHEMREL